MADYDSKLFLRFSKYQLFSIFRSLCSIEYVDFIATLKYFTAYPLAFFLGNDLPDRPKNLLDNPSKYPLFGNEKIRCYFKERMMSSSHKKENCKFLWSLLQGVKRACEDAGDSFIRSSMEKHKNLLSRDHPYDEKLQDQYWRNFVAFFKDFKPSLSNDYEMSNSACWERTRSEGGARGELLDIANDVIYPYQRIVAKTLSSVLYKMIEISPGEVQELRGVRTPTMNEILGESTLSPKAMVAAILEPLKVRLITKGPAANYFIAKSYQKQLLHYIQRYPQFELTGATLREDMIYRMMERESAGSFDNMNFTHFVSGDYSSATDNLGIQYTKTGLEASFTYSVSKEEQNILRTVLYEHEIHYPTKFGIEPFKQTNGQLMGSPLSFPFLCINNLIAYKLSLEEYLGKELSFKGLPTLVNGDDILFRTNPEHYEIWKKHVHAIGFNLSVGKNYIHKNILTINSTMFHYNDKKQLRLVPYCNFGLLSGTSKKGSSRGEVREKAIDLCDAYTQSVGGSSNIKLASARFMTRNRDSISKITHRGRYNLFVPREVGGLGFPIYEGVNFHVTRFQRLLAKLTMEDLDKKPLFGFKSRSSSNAIKGRESRNEKLIMYGIGPLEESVREISTPLHTMPNSDYVSETVTKWFSKIPERYDAGKLFPFRLSESDTIEYRGSRILQWFF